jgi:hypothetical protein
VGREFVQTGQLGHFPGFRASQIEHRKGSHLLSPIGVELVNL